MTYEVGKLIVPLKEILRTIAFLKETSHDVIYQMKLLATQCNITSKLCIAPSQLWQFANVSSLTLKLEVETLQSYNFLDKGTGETL